MDLFSWPEDPPAPPEEQAELAFPGTTAERYRAWRETDDGRRAYGWMAAQAVQDAHPGVRRLSAKALAERCRATLKVRFDNRYTAELAREIQTQYPECRGRFELRMRRAG